MLTRQQESRNFTAISMVDMKEDGTGIPVMYMQATLSADGKLSFSNTIGDTSLYLENKETVDKDWQDFQMNVITKIET